MSDRAGELERGEQLPAETRTRSSDVAAESDTQVQGHELTDSHDGN